IQSINRGDALPSVAQRRVTMQRCTATSEIFAQRSQTRAVPCGDLARQRSSSPVRGPVRIANASGYWGDDPEALARQVRGGDVDYVTLDYLAEITMVILQRQRERNPELGYA